ncbi:unnamed protein product, partial [marine sediment metagenome]
ELVIGHHPHVIQKAEIYNGQYIFYSLGNFIFDQMWSQETREGLVSKFHFTKDGLNKIEFLPVIIYDYAQPKAADDQSAERMLSILDLDLNQQTVFIWNQESEIFEAKTRGVIYHQSDNKTYAIKKTETADLNNDSIEEKYSLESGRLIITQNADTLWGSPTDWWIDDFVLADSTGDGLVNINLAVWKSGNFGDSMPFWIDENDLSIRNHFFVFKFEIDEVRPVWQSSNLSAPNCEFTFGDIN